MGFTLFATLDEFGEFVSTFLVPVALTDEQVSQVIHGSPDWPRQVETYFVVDPRRNMDDESAVDAAMEFIAEAHVIDVKRGLFA